MTYRKAAIRPCLPQDGSLLFALAREAFGERAAWDDRSTLTALESDTVFVATLEDEPAGYVALEREGDAIRVEQLLVSPRHEHEGVGRQLLEYAEGFAIAERAKALQVVVESDNLQARDFYRRRGFRQEGESLLELLLPEG